MNITFLRHGETDYNKRGIYTGQADIPMNTEGREQAIAVRPSLPHTLTHIWCSDLLRTRETCAIVNEFLKLPVTFDARLRERDFGSLTGQYWAEVDKQFPDITAKDRALTYDYRPFGGECVAEVEARLRSVLMDIQKTHSGQDILVVCHGGVVKLIHHIVHGTSTEVIHNSSLHTFAFPDL